MNRCSKAALGRTSVPHRREGWVAGVLCRGKRWMVCAARSEAAGSLPWRSMPLDAFAALPNFRMPATSLQLQRRSGRSEVQRAIRRGWSGSPETALVRLQVSPDQEPRKRTKQKTRRVAADMPCVDLITGEEAVAPPDDLVKGLGRLTFKMLLCVDGAHQVVAQERVSPAQQGSDAGWRCSDVIQS